MPGKERWRDISKEKIDYLDLTLPIYFALNPNLEL